MTRRLIRALCGLALLAPPALATGCGGSELKPDQQREYDTLQAERRDISGRLGAAQRRSEKAFRDLGAAEKRKKIHYKHMVLCGARAEGQRFGPFPWGQKKTAKLKFDRSIKVSGASCGYYEFRVVK